MNRIKLLIAVIIIFSMLLVSTAFAAEPIKVYIDNTRLVM